MLESELRKHNQRAQVARRLTWGASPPYPRPQTARPYSALKGPCCFSETNREADPWEIAAFILGSASIKLTLADLVSEVAQLVKE